MLSALANYLLRGGAASDAEDVEGEAAAASPGRTDEASNVITSIPVEARLRQVDVEGDDWILIDRTVEGFAGMDESWYVTPPACFTQPGPVHVETSPLEDLLIEHPSMSVYRSAGHHTNPPMNNDKHRDGQKQRPAKRKPAVPENSSTTATNTGSSRLPLTPRNNNNLTVAVMTPARPQLTTQVDRRSTASGGSSNNTSNNSNNRTSHHHHHHQHHHNGANVNAVAEQAPRRSSIRDLRNARGDENVRIVQIRSAQKMMEKRSSQSAKRNRLERSNKVREVSSGKGRRPRRQDRLRLNNSGANNNRKC